MKLRNFWNSLTSRIEGKLALKTGIAASISLFMGLNLSHLFDRPDWLVSGVWCVMTAIVVLQVHIGGTYKASFDRFLGVLVGSLMGGLFSSLVSKTFLIEETILDLGLSVFLTIITCSLLNIKESVRIASMSTAAIVILAVFHTEINPWRFTFFRFIDSCLGIIIAIVVAHLFWPEKAVQNLSEIFSKVVNLMSKYYLLSTQLEERSPAHKQSEEELFEDIQEALSDCKKHLEESKLEFRPTPNSLNEWSIALSQFEIIFETITTLKNVHKESLTKMFDDNLANHANDLIQKTDMSLREIEKVLISSSHPAHTESLKISLEELATELIRFRETRATRKFNINDVETFFVFFFSLKIIGEITLKLEEQSRRLLI